LTNRPQLLLIRPQEKRATARGPNSGPEIIAIGEEKILVPNKDTSRHGGFRPYHGGQPCRQSALEKGRLITAGALVLPLQIRELPGEQSHLGREGGGEMDSVR
jgi:hypothetical protein